MPKRYISHSQQPPASQDLPLIERDIRATLVASVDRVLRNTPDVQVKQSAGVYVGIAGTVLMNMHLRALPRELRLGHSHEALLSYNDAYLASALQLFPDILTQPTSPARCAFLETPVGLATLMLEHAHDESLPWRAALDRVRGAVHDVLAERAIADDDGCGVLYGRAGLLYALLRLRPLGDGAAPPPVARAVRDAQIAADATLERIMDSILAHGRYGAKTYATEVSPSAAPPLMWSWRGKRYLGGAHGVAGILHTLLQCPAHLLSPDACADIWATLAWLLRLQDKDGNWRTAAPAADAAFDTHELVQWCHGAPAVLLLLCRALRHPSAARHAHALPALARAVDRAAALVYRHGLLRKGLGACHGVAGSVFALLACARLYLHPPAAWAEGEAPAWAGEAPAGAGHARRESAEGSEGSAGSPTPTAHAPVTSAAATSPQSAPSAQTMPALAPLLTPLATLAAPPSSRTSPPSSRTSPPSSLSSPPTPLTTPLPPHASLSSPPTAHPPPAPNLEATGRAADLEAKGRAAVARAAHLAHLARTPAVCAKMGVPARPHSLYEGLGGMCCAWAAVLGALRACGAREGCWGVPGYDDLGL